VLLQSVVIPAADMMAQIMFTIDMVIGESHLTLIAAMVIGESC